METRHPQRAADTALRVTTRRHAAWRAPAGRPERLLRSQLGVVDIAASTMANIAPAMSFYFGFSFLALTAGVASPLTILVAAVAVAFLGNTLAQFARAHPSTGSFITFIGKAFGPTSAIATSIVLIMGYVVAIVAVIAMSGGFTAIFLNHYLPAVPLSVWPFFVVGFVALGAYLMVRGIHISTRWAGMFFAFEVTVLVLVSLLALVQHRGHLTLHPFDPHYLDHGLRGLALGFPLAVYMFIGWENSATLAEETDRPRRNVPRAIFTSIAAMAGAYLLFAYATVEGFRENVTSLSTAPIAFITLADGVLGGLALFAYLAGVTSTVACVIAAVNSQSRLLFNAGREGLLPAWLGRVYPRRGTPVNALLAFMGIGLVLVLTWSVGQHVGPVTLFSEASTLGTMMVIVVYFTANLALPVYYRRFRPAEFSPLKHIVMPAIGAVAIGVPIYELFRPGIASPYDWFPYITLGVILCAVVYAVILSSHDRTLAERVGSLVADDPHDGKFVAGLDEDAAGGLDERLHRALDLLTNAGDLTAVLPDALRLVAEGVSAGSAAVFEAGPGGDGRLLAACGEVRRRGPCPRLPLDDPALVGLESGLRRVVGDALSQLPPALSAVACRDCRSVVLIAAPKGAATSLLVLTMSDEAGLTESQTAFAAAAAGVIALAVRNAALTDEAKRSATVLQTAYAVARAITHSLDLEDTYQEIVAGAARVVDGSRCVLLERERGSDDFVVVAASGSERERFLHRRVRLEGFGSEAIDGRVLPGAIVQELAARGAASLGANKFGHGGGAASIFTPSLSLESSLLVPLAAQHELVGSLLVFASSRRRGFSPSEVAELQSVGQQAAISIHNALLFRDLEASQHRVEALLGRLARLREHERQALARVVHDDIIQSIVGAVYRLESVHDDIPPAQVAAVDEAATVLREIVHDARRVIWGLRPPALEGLGLSQALVALADRARRQSQVEVSATIADVTEVGDDVTTALYKIAREAVLNAVNHARAERIGIALAQLDIDGRRAIRLHVEDDGIGFDTDDGDELDHFGRAMMAEQAALVGATFSLVSANGHGTDVEVTVPVDADGRPRG